MAITMGQALQIPQLQEMTVVGGARGLGRVIECVDVLEVPDVARWLRAGEFVVTTCYAVKDDPAAQLNIIRVMHAANGAGVAVKFGRFLGKVPEPMKELADELEIPLLAIPDHLSFMDITLPLMTAMIDEQSLRLKYSEKVRRKMIQAALGANGLDTVCTMLAELTGHEVMICNGEMNNLAIAGGDFFHKQKFTKADLQNFKQPERHPPIAAFPIEVRQRCYGYILLACPTPLTELHCVAIEHAITLAAVQLVKEEAVEQAQQSYYRDLLEDLISGAFKSRELIVSRAESLDLLLSKPQVILIVDIDHFSGYIMKDSTDYEQKAAALKRRMAQIVTALVKTFVWRALVVQRSDSVVVIMPVLSDEKDKAAKMNFRERLHGLSQCIQQKIQEEYPEITVSIGISAQIDDPLDIAANYQEVRTVLKLSKKMNGEGKIAFWSDFEIYLLLEKLGKPVERYYQMKLGALQEAKNYKELLATLKAYLDCQGNSMEAAKKLYIHRNTLRYRLQRIEKILGRDLMQADERFTLLLAIKVGELINDKQ